MSKKSFKKSAQDSVASAFFSKDIKNAENVQGTQDINKKEELPPYRINLKLKGEYKEYLDQVSWENRTSITQYLNDLIGKDMEEYEKIR